MSSAPDLEKAPVLNSVEDYELEARKRLSPSLVNYIYGATETGATCRRNVDQFSKYLLRRRVLQTLERVICEVSYFDGRIKSELPFFPDPINVSPLGPDALSDLLKISRSFSVPIFISDIAVVPPLEINKIPDTLKRKVPLIWQIYIRAENRESIFKRAKLAESWGYSGIALTVDAEMNVKLGYEVPIELRRYSLERVTVADIRQIREATNLPLIVKGVMSAEDGRVAIENGADGVIVSNHGGRIMDSGESSLEVLPEVVKEVNKKSASGPEVFFDGGIRRGTDILKALALGARGCLIGRPLFSGIVVDGEHGAERIVSILREELVRSAFLCAVEDLSRVSPAVVRGPV